MEIKLNLLEMSFDQRRDTANFLLTYPPAVPLVETVESTLQDILNAPKSDVFKAAYVAGATMGMGNTRLPELDKVITEEQRLDAEQKSDLEEVRELAAAAGANLNAIFGAPIPQVPTDKEGLPWDHRIHASTKTFIADGTWKLKRGVDAAEVESVKAQLKALMAVPPPLATVYIKGALSGPIDDVIHSTGHVDYLPATRIPAPPPPAPTVTLTDLIARMSAAIVAGKMTQAVVAGMCNKHGVSEFMLLSSRPDLLPLIDADMKAMGV